jgi:hypothetical protein
MLSAAEYLAWAVSAVLLVGAALVGLSALLVGAGGKLTRLARILLMAGGALGLLAFLFELLGPTAVASKGAGRLHLWFSGITVVLVLLTAVSPHLERRARWSDGRYEAIGYVLTGMLAVIAVFYGHVAGSAAAGSKVNLPVTAETSVYGAETCESPDFSPDKAEATGVCSAPSVVPSLGATQAVHAPPPGRALDPPIR